MFELPMVAHTDSLCGEDPAGRRRSRWRMPACRRMRDTGGPMTEARVKVDDGVRLWTACTGDGPPLLLCHGGPGAFDTLELLAELIGEVATVHRWDQRGAGRSDREGPYTIERFIADMECLREHFGYERWTLGGHSWGANLALMYAQHHPSRVNAVVYIAGTGLEWWPHFRRRYGQERRRRLGAARARRLAELAGLDRTDDQAYEFRYLHTLVEFSDPSTAPELADQVVAEDLRFEMNLEVNEALNAQVKARSLEADVELCRRIDVPVLVVDCAGDVRPVDATDSLVAALPDVQRVRIATGHYPWLERPGELQALLHDFLETKVAATASSQAKERWDRRGEQPKSARQEPGR